MCGSMPEDFKNTTMHAFKKLETIIGESVFLLGQQANNIV